MVVAAVAMVQVGHRRPSGARQAALLAVAAGIAWGFVAAIMKELSSHLERRPVAVFSNWSPYVLVLVGAVAMFLNSTAFQAGSLAAVQPGLTLVDPLVASLLGITIFGEHLASDPARLATMAVAGVLLGASVILLVRSPIIQTAEPSVIAEDSHNGHAPSPALGPPPPVAGGRPQPVSDTAGGS